MDTVYFKLITIRDQFHKYSGSISHFAMNYIDDTSNAIFCNDSNTLQNYINDFFLLVEKFYNANKLSLNNNKSKLIISCKGRYRAAANNISLVTTNYLTKQSSKVKVLGYI